MYPELREFAAIAIPSLCTLTAIGIVGWAVLLRSGEAVINENTPKLARIIDWKKGLRQIGKSAPTTTGRKK